MYFLAEHNRDSKETKWFEYKEYQQANDKCLAKEQQYIASGQDEMEVVIFEADSLDDLRRTHSRYFVKAEGKKAQAQTSDILVTIGLVALGVVVLKAILDKKE